MQLVLGQEEPSSEGQTEAERMHSWGIFQKRTIQGNRRLIIGSESLRPLAAIRSLRCGVLSHLHTWTLSKVLYLVILNHLSHEGVVFFLDVFKGNIQVAQRIVRDISIYAYILGPYHRGLTLYRF